MKRLFFAALAATALAATAFATCAYAQNNDSGPFATPSGKLQFVYADHEYAATLDEQTFDRFGASTLTHFDDASDDTDTVTRTLVQTDAGPVLYEFGHRPPVVLRTGLRMTVKRVFWQADEVVMQGSQGWFRFKHGVLTKLQSSTTIYH